MDTSVLRAIAFTLGIFHVSVFGEDYTYVTNSGTITITGYSGLGGDVAIPDTINGLAVTGIGADALAVNGSLTSVTIPNSVIVIGLNAFYGCAGLVRLDVNPLNPVYSSMDGVLLNKSQTTLIRCPGGKTGNYTLPDTVKEIADYAFGDCRLLTGITMGNNLKRIGSSAFQSCGELMNVTIPEGVTNVGTGAFAWSGLRSITIPRSVTRIENYAFNMCTVLSAVGFWGDAPSLGYNAFGGDDNATAYHLPGTTGWGAYYGYIPTAPWALPFPVILSSGPSFGIRTNRMGFRISWATNVPVVVEASALLNNPAWSALSTNTLVGGWSHFSDPHWTNYSSRFYRVRAQ
jgi:hypothetical protein